VIHTTLSMTGTDEKGKVVVAALRSVIGISFDNINVLVVLWNGGIWYLRAAKCSF